MTTMEFNSELMQYEPNLKGFAINLTTNVDDAGDLVNDTYLKALRNKDKYMANSRQNMKTWLFTIMKNTFINRYRRKNKHPMTFSPDMGMYMQTKHDKETPEARYQYDELKSIINTIDEKHRIPFEMYLQGYKYNEIADKMNVNLGTIKSRIFQTRKKLRVMLN